MIKEGDKLICIEDIWHYSNEYINFIKGKAYKIHRVGENIDAGRYYTSTENGVEATLCFNDTESSCYTENFVTLAEWRNLQIDSILD